MKKNILRYLLCVMMFALILASAAFAELKMADEKELALANASVTGAPVQDQAANPGVILPETDQTDPTFDKGAAAFAPAASNVQDGLGLNLNIKGEGTFKFEFGPYTYEHFRRHHQA